MANLAKLVWLSVDLSKLLACKIVQSMTFCGAKIDQQLKK